MVNPLASTISASHAIDLPVRTGQVLDGKFRVERIIGEGAMGLVVEATHLALDERVALKFLRSSVRARPDIVSRFAREARAAVKINSDHVARVFDVGGADDGTPFIVMEFLEGRDLEHVLVAQGQLEIADAAEYIIHACEGVTSAHARGIVHRDIKPANLFIIENASGKQVKLLDFGISKAGITESEVDVSSASTTQIMGSPHYMSPEQIRSTKDVDNRADIWSLGVVLFELLTGQTPFSATEVTGIIAQVLYEPHRPLHLIRSDVPAPLEHIVDTCLAKDPAKRFTTAAELAVALLPFAPKRARAVAEKAMAIARTTGQVPFQTANAMDSLPPSAPSGLRPTAIQSGDTVQFGALPAAVALAQIAAATTSSSGSMPIIAAAQSSPSLGIPPPNALVPSRQPPPPSRASSAMLYIALAAMIIGVAGGVFALVAHLRAPPTPNPNPVVAIATPPPLVVSAALPVTTTTQIEPKNEPPVASEAQSAQPPVRIPVATTPPAIARPLPITNPNPITRPVVSPTTPPVVKPTDSDIRHER